MKTDQQVLLVLIPGFPENEEDSSCLPAQQVLIRSLDRNYPALKIVVYSFQYPYEKKEYQWHGIDVKSFGGSNKGGFSRLFLWGRIEKEIRTIAASNQIKAILSFWAGECALVGKRMAAKLNLPFYCWLMGQDARLGNRYMKRLRPLSTELVAISDSIRDECYGSHLVRPAHVIPLGIEPNEFTLTTIDRDIDIIGVGSLIGLKQYDVFIRVLEQLKNSFPTIKAMLVGNGPEQERFREIIDEKGLNENIELKGELPHKQVLELMQRAKILLHPSSFEGFSGVCLEALYAGARVISFCQPMKEKVPNWENVGTEEMMIEKAGKILGSVSQFQPVLYYSADQSAREFVRLLF